MATALWWIAVATGWTGIGTALAAGISRGDGPLYGPDSPRHHRQLMVLTVVLVAASAALIITAAALH